MRPSRFLWAVLAAGCLLTSFGVSEAQAQRFFYYSPRGPYIPNPPVMPYYSYSYNPYVAPYPAYGVMPGPVILNPWQYSNESYQGRTAEDYGYWRDSYEPAPRKRNSLYPAVPFEQKAADLVNDKTRVRFEIAVPREDAVVLIDGVETKQTGINRVFFTPPMTEDRLFSSTFEVRWTDEAGKRQSIQRTFEFVAGETVRHQFKATP